MPPWLDIISFQPPKSISLLPGHVSSIMSPQTSYYFRIKYLHLCQLFSLKRKHQRVREPSWQIYYNPWLKVYSHLNGWCSFKSRVLINVAIFEQLISLVPNTPAADGNTRPQRAAGNPLSLNLQDSDRPAFSKPVRKLNSPPLESAAFSAINLTEMKHSSLRELSLSSSH